LKTLHFDCFAGISGDMALGAFVDLGVDPAILRSELEKLGLTGWKLRFERDQRCGITGTHAVVDLGDRQDHLAMDGTPDSPGSDPGSIGIPGQTAEGSADVQYHYHGQEGHHQGHSHGDHAHPHEHDGIHDHTNESDDSGHDNIHSHGQDHGDHSGAAWKDIRTLIQGAGLSEGTKKRALDIFTRIAEAESQVHGTAPEDITFHEVGALDSIIDILGVAICLDLLKPDRITCSAIELGGGMVRCAHGVLPVPAPATVILTRGMPVRTGGFQKEMTTPTGAAILASAVDEFVDKRSFREIKTGYGIGTRKMDKPNVLRVSLREEDPVQNTGPAGDLWKTEELILMETNIDDMTGEALGFLMESLFTAGALDVTFTPCVMKKSRPGTIVSVLTDPEKIGPLREILFRKSSAIGFREIPVRRLSLRREEDRLNPEAGISGIWASDLSKAAGFVNARRKTVFYGTERLRSKIEFEDRARLARERDISLEEAERIIKDGFAEK
jgi:uncharacterized protein (TIGR00299 family) protein